MPSLALLVVFMLLDSYKLLDVKAAIIAIGIGALSAVASYFVNTPLVENTGIDWLTYSRYGAPVVEEFFKGVVLVYLPSTVLPWAPASP